MVGISSRQFSRPLQALLEKGIFSQLTDVELLERFTRQEDAEAAFEALVVRHGPAVMRVCRRILGNSHNAEDAFQATFLVLSRRAHSLARPQALVGWLQGVARRVAHKARISAARRRIHERRFAQRAQHARTALEDVTGWLHDELRPICPNPPSSAPVVLCYLEELSYESAARRLGLTEGTIRGRLVKARDLLRTRLARRGEISPLRPRNGRSDGLNVPQSTVPPTPIAATTRAAIRSATGGLGTVASRLLLST